MECGKKGDGYIPEKIPVITGQRGEFHWIVWDSQFLGELVSAVPGIVAGKFVIVTSFDSGPFIPSDELKNRGWILKSGLAYSPRVTSPDELPSNQFDEWYVFASRREISPPEVFINYDGFRLRYYAADITLHGYLERFWLQMERLQPESYLAEGESLIFVTRDADLYELALEWKFRLPEQP
ncbi:MAG: hypothetical protein JW748_07925 [Anaerolineales bacterium]|nr:hypothetical protein [Anaerolineales bacterium]